MSILSLEQWRENIQYNPWHFWGLGGPSAPVNSSCNTLVKKYNWQSADAAGRQGIQEAIDVAESRLINLMRYAPGPHFKVETHAWPRYPNNMVERRGYAGADSRWVTIQLEEGKVIQAGVETRTLIDDNLAVIFSDEDADGLNETFTVTFPTTVTDVTQIELQFSAVDRLDGEGASDAWAIKPTKTTIAGGTATVKGRSWLLVRPLLYEGFTPAGLDAVSPNNYVTTLDAYRHYCDPTGSAVATAQGKLIWESRPWPWWSFYDPNTSTDPAAVAYAIARVGMRDAELGIVDVGKSVYDQQNGTWTGVDWRYERPPDRVEIRYYAGVPLQANGKLEARMGRLTAILAMAELSSRICACDTANRELYRWQFDLAHTGASQEQFQAVSPDDLTNPWGTRRGQVYAYRELLNARILQGFSP